MHFIVILVIFYIHKVGWISCKILYVCDPSFGASKCNFYSFFYIHGWNFHIPVFVHKLLISLVSTRDVFFVKLDGVLLLTGCILVTLISSGKAGCYCENEYRLRMLERERIKRHGEE
jgi:hypothetical protein